MAERWVLDNYKTPLDDIVRQAIILFESFEKFLKIEADLLDKLQDSNWHNLPLHWMAPIVT